MNGYRLTIVTEWSQGSQLIQSNDFETLEAAQKAEKAVRKMLTRVCASEITAINDFHTFIEKLDNGSTIYRGEEQSCYRSEKMTYILKVATRYNYSAVRPKPQSWGFMSYDEACKKMVEELEKLNRQIMDTELTDVTGYTIILNYWVGGKKFKKVAVIEHDISMEDI